MPSVAPNWLKIGVTLAGFFKSNWNILKASGRNRMPVILVFKN